MDLLEAAAGSVLVEGPDLHLPHGEGSRLGPELASLLNSRVLLLFGYAKGLDAFTVANASAPFGNRLAGVVINGVPVYRRREVDDKLLSDLRSLGMPVLGALPEDRAMLAVTVQQIADHLGGSWVQEPVNTDAYVDQFLIGGNIMDSGPTYFGRFQHQAVVTRAERPDIQLASLMQATRCLVLTGGAQPTEYIKAEALQREVPLILVQEGTLATAEALGGLLAQANPYSQQKVQRFAELVRQHLDPAVLDAALR
jgi:BioD-like phosphotransacetylase family protein